MAAANHLKNIAIVGAGGQFGKRIAHSIIAQGKHELTALTRGGANTSNFPKGLAAVKTIDYDNPSSIASALKGQDALVITMGVLAPASNHTALINAAREAGVKWIMPNEYGVDPLGPNNLGADTKVGPKILGIRKEIEDAGLNWTSVICSFWYEFSLAGQDVRYGFDFPKKEVTFIDDGTTKIPHSTWPRAADAVARILALPIVRQNGEFSLEQVKNRGVYVRSFQASQRDILDSVLRVSGDKESDWTIKHEGHKERYERGGQVSASGDFSGHAIVLYTRVFYPDGASDFSAQLNNKDLGFEDEEIDPATALAIEMNKDSNGNWLHHW